MLGLELKETANLRAQGLRRRKATRQDNGGVAGRASERWDRCCRVPAFDVVAKSCRAGQGRAGLDIWARACLPRGVKRKTAMTLSRRNSQKVKEGQEAN